MPDTREALIEAMARAKAREECGASEADWNKATPSFRGAFLRIAASALAAIEAAGCMVVPLVATPRMRDAGSIMSWDVWGNMLAASPFAKRGEFSGNPG